MEKEGAWHHPKFSSVLYLSDGGGPSLIINQTLASPIDPTANGVFMTPLSGVFARFKVRRTIVIDYCWHLGCILPRVPAIIVRAG